jgi:hypothetical protein
MPFLVRAHLFCFSRHVGNSFFVSFTFHVCPWKLRHVLEIMVSKFSNIMININKVIGNGSTFLSGGVTLCTQNVKYFCHLSVYIPVVAFYPSEYLNTSVYTFYTNKITHVWFFGYIVQPYFSNQISPICLGIRLLGYLKVCRHSVIDKHMVYNNLGNNIKSIWM